MGAIAFGLRERERERGGGVAQVRPYLEYGVLTCMSSAATHLRRLDKVKRRMQRLIESHNCPPPSQDTPALDTLKHRRDVAAVVILHKTQVQVVQSLAGLRLPPREAVRHEKGALQPRASRGAEVTHQPTPEDFHWLLTDGEDHSSRPCYYKVSSSAFEIVP